MVPVPGLPPGFEGYTILHVSDFETIRPGSRESQVRALVSSVRPDAILVTGDLVSKDLDGDEYADMIVAVLRLTRAGDVI